MYSSFLCKKFESILEIFFSNCSIVMSAFPVKIDFHEMDITSGLDVLIGVEGDDEHGVPGLERDVGVWGGVVENNLFRKRLVPAGSEEVLSRLKETELQRGSEYRNSQVFK